MMVSPVFKSMFKGGFMEANTNEVTLTGKKLEDVRLMLDCLYPDTYVCLTGKAMYCGGNIVIGKFLHQAVMCVLLVIRD